MPQDSQSLTAVLSHINTFPVIQSLCFSISQTLTYRQHLCNALIFLHYFYPKKPARLSPVHTCYTPRPSHSLQLNYPNNIPWAVQTMKLFQFSLTLSALRPKVLLSAAFWDTLRAAFPLSADPNCHTNTRRQAKLKTVHSYGNMSTEVKATGLVTGTFLFVAFKLWSRSVSVPVHRQTATV